MSPARTRAGTPRAREAFGIPVPPSWLVRLATSARGAIGRVHERSGAAPQLMLERLFGLLDTKSLFTVVELAVPDVLASGPRTAGEIAAATGADADALGRVLRYLASRGLFRLRRGGRFANSPTTEILRRDHPYSWRDWVLFLGSGWSWRVWNELPRRVGGDGSACERALGCDFFTFVNERDPAAGAIFAGAQAAGSRVQAMLFAEQFDFSGVANVCDVGGGSGSVVAHLLRVFPEMRGTVLDVAAVRDAATTTFLTAGVGERARFVAGDFFEAVPVGFDLYLLFAVIHDWDDEACVRILSNVRRAMPPTGRVAVVEGHVHTDRSAEFTKASDLLMLVFSAGGRERTHAEFDAIFGRAGLAERRRITLPSLFDVHELAPSP